MSPDYGQHIAEAFKKYLQTSDDTVIKQYNVKQLKTAISMLSPYYDNNKQWYRQIERRIEELSNIEETRHQTTANLIERFKDKWLASIVTFTIGLLVGLFIKIF